MKVFLYSAPKEKYIDHINLCLDNFNMIFPLFVETAKRILNSKNVKDALKKMVLYHDIGKLTKKWQEYIGTNKKLPSHAPIGASYLWRTLPEGLKEPISFAVAIHHADKGLLSDNIERPDVQAIIDGIVDYDGKIEWSDATTTLENEYFDETIKELNVNDLKDMARGLRIWAKGCSILEQHKRRLQVSICHHILKLCDISAASERKEWENENIEKDDLYGGWLMVKNITSYINNIRERIRCQEK